MIGIYKITNKINGKFYIGQSNNIKRRFAEHLIEKHQPNLSLKRALKKYGRKNFELTILEKMPNATREELNEKEMYYIQKLKPKYHRTKGGSGVKGMYVSEETREKLRQAGKRQWANMTEEQRRNVIENNLKRPPIGHPVSEKTRKILSKINLGKKQSQETIEKRKKAFAKKREKGWVKDGSACNKRVVIVELNMEFESVKKCGNYLGVKGGNGVSAVLNGRQKTCKGYHIKYVV